MAWWKKCKLPLTVGCKVYQSSLANIYTHPRDKTMLQKAPRAACRHMWSHPLPQGSALSLHQVHHSNFLLIYPPDKHHCTTTPKCQIHLLMVSQVQSAQQKAGYLETDEGEAPQLHQPGGSSKLCTCSWVIPVVHRTGPSPAQGPRAMGYSPHPLRELSDCIQTAQHCLRCFWVPSEKLPDCTGHSCAGDTLRNYIHKCRTTSEANICFSSIS